MPAGTEKLCGRGVLGHGIVVELAVLGLQLESMILRIFSNLNNSMVLQFDDQT